MYTLHYEKDISHLTEEPTELVEAIQNILVNLDICYGSCREKDGDGGCIILIQSENEIWYPLENETGIIIGESIPEYAELLYTSKGDYINALFLLNNDYGVNLFLKKEIAPIILLEEIEQ